MRHFGTGGGHVGDLHLRRCSKSDREALGVGEGERDEEEEERREDQMEVVNSSAGGCHQLGLCGPDFGAG